MCPSHVVQKRLGGVLGIVALPANWRRAVRPLPGLWGGVIPRGLRHSPDAGKGCTQSQLLCPGVSVRFFSLLSFGSVTGFSSVANQCILKQTRRLRMVPLWLLTVFFVSVGALHSGHFISLWPFPASKPRLGQTHLWPHLPALPRWSKPAKRRLRTNPAG